MRIPVSKSQVVEYSRQYKYADDSELVRRLGEARQRGFLKRDDLIKVAEWKWRGGLTRQLVSENSEADVKEITAAAFATRNERLRIGALLSLSGVDWPMASVILHFAFPDRYPILDVRVMRAVGGPAHYSFNRWIKYAEFSRRAADAMGVSIRELDRALWLFDKGGPKLKKTRSRS